MRKKTMVSWVLPEIKTLRILCARGMSAAKIHKSHLLPRHTESGIMEKMSELELGDPSVRQRTLNAKRLSPDRRAEVLAFLTKEGRRMPSVEAAQKLQIDQRMVIYYRRHYHLRLPNHLRFTSNRFLETHAHVIAVINKKLADHWQKFWESRPEQLYRQLVIDANQSRISSYLECKSCHQRWPRNPKYFYLGRKQKNGERRIQPYCRACGRKLWGKRLKSE